MGKNKSESKPSEAKVTSKKSDVSSILDDYNNDLGAMELTHASFDDKEKMLLSQPIDAISVKETGSKLTDQTLLSSVLKQNNTEMAQLPSGKVIALTKHNRGKSLMMDAILRGHVIPHANSQFDVFTKLWLFSFYRKMYGAAGVLVDFVTGKNGYIGPDFTLLPARSIIPFAGKTNVDDGVWVRSRVNRKYLESRDKDVWKNIDDVLATSGDRAVDLNAQSQVERQSEGVMVTKDEYELITRYEGDRWRTFHAATKTEIRDIANPQKNDQVPVIMCYAYPLLDRFFGLGDFERGQTLYGAQSALINLFFAALKMGIFAPMKIDPSTIDNWDDFKDGIGPGQIWLMKKNNFDGIAQMRLDTAGAVNSFQSTANFLKSSVLTLMNTSDTSVSSAQDPGFGKTPQALKMQAYAQGMQAQFGRRMLELSTEKIFDRMIDLVSKKQEKDMNFYLGKRDLESIAEVAPDVVEMFEVGDTGKVTIKPNEINNTDYRYEIDQGSTVKKDEMVENETLKDMTAFVLKNVPGAADSLQNDGLVPMGSKVYDLGESMKRIAISSGVTDWDQIIRDRKAEEKTEQPTEVPPENNLNMESPEAAAATMNQFPPQQPQMPMPQPAPTMNETPIEFTDQSTAAAAEELSRLIRR